MAGAAARAAQENEHSKMASIQRKSIAQASFSFLRRAGCTMNETPMLSRYKANSGAAKTHMVSGSGVGVMMAAMMKTIRMANLMFFHRNFGLTMPKSDKKSTRIGSS